MSYIQNDIVTLASNRVSSDCVVVHVRVVTRGRFAGRTEYTLAPLNGKVRGYCKVKGETLLSPARARYTAAQVADAKSRQTGVVDQRREVKRSNNNRRAKALDKLRVEPGDRVTIRRRGFGSWTAEVIDVNERTGKVAIAATRNKSGRRWISAAAIISVTKGGAA